MHVKEATPFVVWEGGGELLETITKGEQLPKEGRFSKIVTSSIIKVCAKAPQGLHLELRIMSFMPSYFYGSLDLCVSNFLFLRFYIQIKIFIIFYWLNFIA